jgi:hypothetical protein
VQAWLTETGQKFALDVPQLRRLAESKVATPVIDLMVALSNPKRFLIDRGEERKAIPAVSLNERERANAAAEYGDDYFFGSRFYGYSFMDRLYLDPYMRYRYGSYRSNYFGSGGIFGYYPGTQPVVIVVREGAAAAKPKVVNGKGFTQGSSTAQSGGSTSSSPPRASSSGSSSSGSAGSSTGAAAAPTRVAKPKGGGGG